MGERVWLTMKYLGNCIHCNLPGYYDEDNDRIIFKHDPIDCHHQLKESDLEQYNLQTIYNNNRTE